MKRRLLALATALVMIIGLLPATILTVSAETTYIDLSTLATGDFSQPDGDSYALTLNGTYTHETNGSTDLDSKYLNNLLNDMSTVHLSQTIKVDQMTKYSKTTFQGDYFKLNGLFNTVVRNQRKYEGTTQNIGDYLMYTIQHRANANGTDDGSLYLIVAYSTGMNANYTPTLAYNDPVALGKKEGEEFRLTTIWNEDNSASFYVDGTLLATYTSDKALVTQKWSGSSVAYLYFGYFDSNTVADGYETTAKMTFSNFRVTNDHIPETDDGDCTTAIKCAECGEIATAGNASHTFNRKIATSDYAKDGETGVFYTSCSVCGKSSKDFSGDVFTAADLSGASGIENTDFTLDGNYSVTLNGTYTSASNTINGTTELDTLTLGDPLDDMSTVHLSQTIQIDQMTRFKTITMQGNTYKMNAFFNTIVRNQHPVSEEDDTNISDYLMYNIQRRAGVDGTGTDDGSLYLVVAYSSAYDSATYKSTIGYYTPVDLGKNLGEAFRLTTIWDEDGSASFYVDGTHLVTYTNVTNDDDTYQNPTITQGHSGSYAKYLYFGYHDAYPVTTEGIYESTASMTISGITVSGDHIPEEDDGDCTTAVKCIECGEVVVDGNPNHTAAEKADTYCTTDTVCVNCGTVMEEGAADHTPDLNHNDCGDDHVCAAPGCNYVIAEAGSHTPGDDDGNCATAVMCSVCGKVATPAHELTEVPETPATNTTDGMKAHWKCETCDVLYATADGTGGVVDAATLVIPKLAGKVEVEDATVTDAVNNAGEGDVSLDVTDAEYNTSSVQMSNASLLALVNALEQSGKSVVITTDEGVVTVDAAALAAIQTAVGEAENMAIKVKQEANTVLSETQKNALAAYPTLRTVVKAELLVAGTETAVDFGEGAVTVKIPFTPGLGVAGSAYKLVYVSDEGQIEEVTTTYETGYLTATLGHFSDYAIVSEQAETEIIEDTIDRDGGSATQSVYGTYNAADDATVFSVDVNWGSLNFTYQAEVKGTWNAATHQYDNAIAEGWLDNDEAYVEVVNHSNVAIDVAVTKNAEEIIADVGVTLTNTNYTLASGTTTTFATADSQKTTIEPYGTLTEEHNNEKIAEITVTITEANA